MKEGILGSSDIVIEWGFVGLLVVVTERRINRED